MSVPQSTVLALISMFHHLEQSIGMESTESTESVFSFDKNLLLGL
jgi:hypothetical protein